MGSIAKVPVASALARPRRRPDDDEERTQLRAKIARLEQEIEEERAERAAERSDNDAIFEIMASQNPQIAAILQEKRRKREALAAVRAEALAAARAEAAETDQQRGTTSGTAGDLSPSDVEFY